MQRLKCLVSRRSEGEEVEEGAGFQSMVNQPVSQTTLPPIEDLMTNTFELGSKVRLIPPLYLENSPFMYYGL